MEGQMLGICLVVIFALWLIDRHNLWKTVGKVFGILSIVGVCAMIGLYAYAVHYDRVRAHDAAHEQPGTGGMSWE